MDPIELHPISKNWQLPAPDRAPLPPPLLRTNLRYLASRLGRFEHHLMVVAKIGETQLEIATASEPLYFAHANISDEYALALPTGDALIDQLPLRTFFSDPIAGDDLARVKHGVGDILLHPYGSLHWPGRLRPPFAPPDFVPVGRRALLSLVFCASTALPPDQRPLSVDRDDAFKISREPGVPMHLIHTLSAETQTVARVGDTTMDLVVSPGTISAKNGCYVCVLGGAPPHAPCDLIYVPAGSELAGEGIERALMIASPSASAAPPPTNWYQVPSVPFARFEDADAGRLPETLGELRFENLDAERVRIVLAGETVGEAPRYWLARFLYRLPLHDFRLGYLETYGGFFYDDRGADIRFGVRGKGNTTVPRNDVRAAVERAYRAIAPASYRERLV
jgi:hypothetical protein